MDIRFDRIEKAQALMRKQGMIGIMIMNHDDYRYFFGNLRVQPRAIIPAAGDPIMIGFAAEQDELQEEIGDGPVRLFSHVGEQISNVRKVFTELFDGPPPGVEHPSKGKPKVGMQMWFHTPAFLVGLFRKVNLQVELVPSDPVMDELRMVKEPEEIELMRQAQAIAAAGMDRAQELLEPGVTGHQIATEVLYKMMTEGAESTNTPIHVNSGIRSCWIHGTTTREPIERGDLVVIDLTPQVDGYL
jgi:Xaa-Pro aminopeptidase